MVKKTININRHTRKVKGKIVKVKPHKRVMRKTGKKVKYKRVGTFFVAHDELGNFKGSKVIKYKKKKVTKKKPIIKIKKKRKRVKLSKRKRYTSTSELDRDFYLGEINYTDWLKNRTRLQS